MYVTITTPKAAKDFLASSTTLRRVDVSAGVGTHLTFEGVKYLQSLDVVAAPGSSVSFPDLIIVADECYIGLRGGRISVPKLKEVGEFMEVDSNRPELVNYLNGDSRPNEDFVVVNEYIKAEFNNELECPRVVMTDGKPFRWRDQLFNEWIPIANDTLYTLAYNPMTGAIRAGCRTFKNIKTALKHWKDVAEEFDNDVSRVYATREQRAIMYVLALTNLQDELKRK